MATLKRSLRETARKALRSATPGITSSAMPREPASECAEPFPGPSLGSAIGGASTLRASQTLPLGSFHVV